MAGPEFRSLAKAAHPFNSEARIVFCFQCFLDESEGDNTFGIGGFLSKASTWEQLIPEWIKRISPPNVPNKITAFHMTDCSTGGGEFQDKFGWDHDSRHGLIKDLIGILCEHKVALFGGGVDLPGYKNLSTVNGERLGRNEYLLLFQAMAEVVCNNAPLNRLPLNESVAFFCDRNATHQYWANEFHKGMQNDEHLSWRHRIGLKRSPELTRLCSGNMTHPKEQTVV